jgi:deoxyribonuclease IV
MTVFRVRQVLDKAGANGRRSLIKHLPEYSLPVSTKGIFPNAILNAFAGSESKYSEVGLLTEQLLFCDVLDKSRILTSLSTMSIETRQKVEKSKTTEDFICRLDATRRELAMFLRANGGFSIGDVLLDQELRGTNVAGHPDGIYRNNTHQIFVEVKTSSKLDADHAYFMSQLCSYIGLGLGTSSTDHVDASSSSNRRTFGVLMLPLQSAIIVVDGDTWRASGKTAAFMAALEQKAAKMSVTASGPATMSMLDLFNVSALIQHYGIGTHVSKQKTLLQTVVEMRPGIPYQIFLGNNMSAKFSVDAADLAAASEWVKNNNIALYIHAPYVINLAAKVEDDWNTTCLTKCVRYGAELGARGVVVHVGKSTDQPLDQARNNMFCAVAQVLEHVDPRCPLLIETPAGQGTEMYRAADDFANFICQFEEVDPANAEKLGACVDTCHVFACGFVPSEYLRYIHSLDILRLVHYNDSNDTCGSCKDRHAPVGQGHIGIGEMTAVADFCGQYNIPMVVE